MVFQSIFTKNKYYFIECKFDAFLVSKKKSPSTLLNAGKTLLKVRFCQKTPITEAKSHRLYIVFHLQDKLL